MAMAAAAAASFAIPTPSTDYLDALRAAGGLAEHHPMMVELQLTPPAYLGLKPTVVTGSELSAIQQYLNGVAARLDAPADKIHTMMMAYRTPAEAIEIYAQNHDVDLVVMSTHGRGGLSRLVFGSVADAVIQATQFPVLVYRPALKL